MLRLGARPGTRHREPPYAAMPARVPAAAVVWWWRWRGITVYPGRGAGWYEGGVRRQCEAVSEERLAGRLEKVTDRLAADAGNMERSGTELIGYFLSP
jgi:hypothetical protein